MSRWGLNSPQLLDLISEFQLKGNPGTLPLLVTITAAGEWKLFSAREVMAFYTDALAFHPETRRSTDAYLQRVVRGNQKEGFELVGTSSQNKLRGETFARQDFKKGLVYEAVLAKACDAQALVFIFAGSDRDRANKLIAGTGIKARFGKFGMWPQRNESHATMKRDRRCS